MKEMRTDLLEKSPFKLMMQLSLPAIVGMLVIGLYSFMDAAFVGHMVGSSAMGAVSVAYPFTLFNNGVATLVGVGSASVLSRAVGRKDTATVDKIMGNLVVVVGILSAVVAVLGIAFAPQLISLTGATGDIYDMAVRYIRVVYIGSLFVNFSQSANMVMRAEGLMTKAMTLMGIGAILNIALDPIFIHYFGENGVIGAAVATVISQLVQAILTLHYFIRRSKNVRFHKIRLEKSLLPSIFSIGVSAMLMQVMSFVQQTVMYNVASEYGGNTQIVIMGAAMRYMMFSFIPLWGIGQGMQPAVGTNFGAKLYPRVKKVTNTFILGAVALSLVFWIPAQLFPSGVLAIFIPDNPEIVAQGVGFFRLMYSIFPATAIFITGLTFFQSIGKGTMASVIVLLRQVLLFVPLAYILPMFIQELGIWATTPVTDGVVFVITIVSLIRGYRNLGKENIKEKTIQNSK